MVLFLHSQTDSQAVVIDASRYPLDTDSARLATNHEITHVLAYRRYGPSPDVRVFGEIPSHHLFEEALAQCEEPRGGLEEYLCGLTSSSRYLSVSETNMLSHGVAHYLAIAQFRALIRMLHDRWGWEAVLAVPENRAQRSLEDALEAATGEPYRVVEREWFAYMDSLRSSYVITHRVEEMGDEGAITQDQLPHCN